MTGTAYLSATLQQPPPTSGEGATVILGVVAMAAVVVVLAAWGVRALRWFLLRGSGGRSGPSPDMGRGEKRCPYCGEPARAARVCASCGAVVGGAEGL